MTIRFYIENGLLIPRKEKGNWVFNEVDSQDIEKILMYKRCGFSLQTISQILNISRNSIDDPAELKESLNNLLSKELSRLEAEHNAICEAINLLDAECSSLKKKPVTADRIPLRLFALIACPLCNSSLEWQNITVSQNAITNGSGRCDCGFSCKIDSGILICGEQPVIKSVDVDLETIRKRSAKDISTLEKYFLWLFEHLQALDLRGKVMYEDVINLICFTSKVLPLMETPPDIILSDCLPSAVRYYAEALYAIRPDCGFLMIVDDGIHHPLKKRSIDIVIDYCSSEIVQSYGYSSMFPLIHDYMKPNAIVLGRFSFLHKQKGALGHSIVPTNFIRYNLQVLKSSIAENNIQIIEDVEGEEYLDESVYNGCKPGDKIRPYVFIGRGVVDSASILPDDNSLHSPF